MRKETDKRTEAESHENEPGEEEGSRAASLRGF